ncbi:MAG TPA: MATE family efflux transporter [Caulifigura sp.]|nr:MATE family efflux transporter [Caulifigura sp.]
MSTTVTPVDLPEAFEAPQTPETPPPASETPDAGTVWELFRVALPLIVSSGSLSLMHVVDRMMLTWLDVNALAAAMPAGMFHWTALGFPMGVAVYTNTFIAQYQGSGRKDRVAASLWQGIWLALAFGVILLSSAPFLSRLFASLGHSPEVTRLEIEYFSVLCWGSAPMLLAITLSTFFSGRGQTRVVMYVDIAISILNAILAGLLIFGLGPIPRMGIRGAAVATVTANVAGCIAFAYMIMKVNRDERYPFREQRRLDGELIRRMLRFGLPNGIQMLVDIAGYLMLVLFIGKLGTVELAATNLAFNLNALAFIPMLGLGTAVLTLVGRRIGEKRPDLAEKSVWRALFLAVSYVSLFALIYLVFPDVLLKPYAVEASKPEAVMTAEQLAEFAKEHPPFEEVRPVVIQLLYFVAMYSVFDALAVIFGNAIRGAGDTRFSLIYTFLCGWFLMVIPSYLAVRYSSSPLWSCWWAVTANIAVLGTGLGLRFRSGKWKSMTVIEQAPAGH